jgi:cytochrome b561
MFSKNSSSSYGPLSKFFHMTWGVIVITLYSSVYYKEYFLEEKDPLGRFLIGGVHKPLGTLLLIIMMLAFAWRLSNKKPTYPKSMSSFEKFLATLVQKSLYFFLMAMPLSGFLMSTAGGYAINMFGFFEIPLLFSQNKELAGTLFQVHGYLAWFGLTLIALHILGVLKQEFIRKDSVLPRMFPHIFFKK